MQEVFENIIEKLEELQNYACFPTEWVNEEQSKIHSYYANKLTEILKLTEQHNNGWIPCSERLPEECVPVNVTWINRNPESYYAKIKDVPFSATAVYYNSKWYWYSSTCVDYLSEYGENDFDLVDKDIDIIAWQPLPQPYQPKG